MKLNFFSLLFLLLVSCYSVVYAQGWGALTPPEVGAKWVRPVQGKEAQAVWGHADGIREGLAPLPDPRGLLRIYTPYLGHKEATFLEKRTLFLSMNIICFAGKELH
jgi:hypothetical protein